LLKDLKMDAEGGSSDELDKDIDMDLEFPARKPLNTPEEVLEYWNTCFNKDTLSCLHFREWWRQKVPKIFSPIPSMNYQKPADHIEEEDVQKYFLDLLERFLCNGEPKEVLKQLSSLNDPPAQCGKVFKIGEPTYSCRDCGLDPTCVLCVDCFKNSEHGSHRYKMSTSIGGGYCDCGDPEAWKEHPYCAVHVLGTQTENSDPLSKVPVDIQQRARHVFTGVLKYAYELLTLDTFMKLPGDLQYKERDSVDPMMDDLLEVEDMYVTVLYNDEVHTFDEVITTLQRAVENCDRNLAINFVSLIDREGRCLVKCSPFQQCNEVKRIVERITGRRGIKPLKVMVIHSHVVAHQVFAMRLISWLDGILGYSEGFRALFSRILVEQEMGGNGRKQPSVLENMLRHDTVLWKAARSSIHHLLISGMLLEHASKKEFATVFTNSYGAILKDFINDDHEHSFSVTSLSVQLFTVPTLAHYLVAQQDVLAVLLRTFMSECERKRNAKGKLEFEKNLGLPAFRRANYVLIDLKYLLSIPPTEYDDNTRRGFLHGFSMLLDILSWMQDMDCHTRQVNQHIEFEADWENGFNLHIKLAPVIALLLNWCSNDKVIFVKAYRMLLKKLQEVIKAEEFKTHTVELKDSSAECVQFSVASLPVSLHLPLCRLLAGMSLYLDKFGLRYSGDDFKLMEEDMPSLSLVLEMPLRTSVMVSQVHAGMWRRNGYSLQHQIYFYHNARCRGEMYDRDIQAMQFCAANMNHNSFLVQLMDKFGLVHWANTEFQVAEEESIRHLTALVEEFFGLLVTIVGERFTPGVGDITVEDMVRKEIIQLLCVEPMSHSALNKALPEDVNHETGLEKVIDQVAVFKKPVGTSSKGVYELKEEFYNEYDVFFYHFTREDQSKSEEAQRARLKSANSPQVCPPPSLPALSSNFLGLTSLLQADMMLHLLKLVLQRADDLKSRCFSECQVHKVLYLIGMALGEEERLQKVDPNTSFVFTKKSIEIGLLEAMETLSGSHRIESHRELLAWTIRRFRAISGVEEKMEVVDDTEEEDEEAKKKRAKAAAERRKRIMTQMANQQKTFMTENSRLFDETPSGLRDRLISTCDWEDDTSLDSSFPVCLGPNRSQPYPTETSFTCILCQEEEQLAADNNTLVMASYVQKSTVLSRNREETQPPPSPSTFPFLPSSLSSAPHTSSCGHVMHASCWQKYFDDVSESERRRYRTRHPTSFDIEKSEFLCPLCRSLSNSVIPLIPQYHLLQLPGATGNNISEAMETTEEAEPSSLPAMEVSEETSDGIEMMAEANPDNPTISAEMVTNTVQDVLETVPNLPSSPTPQVVTESESQAASQSPLATGHLDTAVTSTVTVVTSADLPSSQPVDIMPSSPASSHSSSSTELASAHSISSDSTFMSASESPKADQATFCSPQPQSRPPPTVPRTSVVIDFSQWLEALFIALKYRRGLSPEQVSPPPNGGEGQPTDTELSAASTLTRFYTCPLDQVVEELDQRHQDGTSFSRLYMVEDGCELAFPSSVYEIMNSFSQTTYRVGLEGLPHLQDERIPLMVWQSCGFTVHSIVVSAREAEKALFGSLSSRQNDCLSTFIRFCGVVGSNFGEPKVIRSHSLKLLSTILEVDTINPSILEVDMFGLLVSLTYSLPSLFNGEGPAPLPSCNIQDNHILRLMFLGHVTQLLFSMSAKFPTNTKPHFRHCPPVKDCRPLLDLMEVVTSVLDPLDSQEENATSIADPTAVWQEVMEQSIGFLRCCALFYHYLSGVSAPTELTSLLPPDQEFLHLARYLALPSSPRQLLDSPFSLLLAKKWASHPNVHIQVSSASPNLNFVTSVPQLISLPQDYSELINNISSFSCPRSVGEESRIPSMCLVCGMVVCSHSYCCQTELEGVTVGACTAHSHKCGAGSGLFLRVRECKLVMFSGRTKGCYMSPPYLDQYGETDQGLKRGNPLTLCTERYARLHRLWLNHGIAEEVTHNLESSPGFVTTEWLHL